MLTRGCLLLVACWLASQGAFAADKGSTPPHVDIYGPKVCLACIDWADHLRDNGFSATFHGTEDMAAVKRRLKVPPDVESVLTATVAGYFIEGHVPADDIKQLLKEKPKARGLAVPGQPRGAPGFEKSAPFCERGCTILDTVNTEEVVRRELYDTLLVAPNGKTSIWARH
ncbi:MAG TPA: DUF411 domain-containing protein [Rhodocyclaceae bacterium]|nr:DUF411 domain-containing protein [Rhodocyclaceae bacterium]HMV54471.1 DUF411 domain-containing protein [Rhodocyclaceae bacterium]HMZ83176.1 DUF411 domain-containing protein [Rhodocyclaceae bacterium]HNA02867.1 DUF411 domain-containing protein [Rhodocyclaceae bacterium]HNB77925.1 DUF411 domain-containing protein [Rhodocyclaceae bacterium]